MSTSYVLPRRRTQSPSGPRFAFFFVTATSQCAMKSNRGIARACSSVMANVAFTRPALSSCAAPRIVPAVASLAHWAHIAS